MNNVERIKLLKIAKNGTKTENVSQVPKIDAYPEMFLLKVKNLFWYAMIVNGHYSSPRFSVRNATTVWHGLGVGLDFLPKTCVIDI